MIISQLKKLAIMIKGNKTISNCILSLSYSLTMLYKEKPIHEAFF